MSATAWRTSSSLNGLMMAVISFMRGSPKTASARDPVLCDGKKCIFCATVLRDCLRQEESREVSVLKGWPPLSARNWCVEADESLQNRANAELEAACPRFRCTLECN